MDTFKLAKALKALSNPNRLELYLKIVRKNEASFETGNECFISDVASCLKIGAPTVSHHLKELSNAGLIHTERRGKYLVARVNERTVDAINSALAYRRHVKQ